MAGAEFIPGGADDAVSQLLTDPPGPARETTHATVVRAVLAGGQALRGIQLGLEIAADAGRLTGVPTMFGSDVTGTYGGVGWITTFESLDQLEDAEAALAADADWNEMVDAKASGVYAEEPAFTTRSIFRRIA